MYDCTSPIPSCPICMSLPFTSRPPLCRILSTPISCSRFNESFITPSYSPPFHFLFPSLFSPHSPFLPSFFSPHSPFLPSLFFLHSSPPTLPFCLPLRPSIFVDCRCRRVWTWGRTEWRHLEQVHERNHCEEEEKSQVIHLN